MKVGQFYKVAELWVGTHGVTLHANINGVAGLIHEGDVTEDGISIKILGTEWCFTAETWGRFIRIPEVDQRRRNHVEETYYMVYLNVGTHTEILEQAKRVLEDRIARLERHVEMAKEMRTAANVGQLVVDSTYHCKEKTHEADNPSS